MTLQGQKTLGTCSQSMTLQACQKTLCHQGGKEKSLSGKKGNRWVS
jgi:hypothetical protein